MQQVRWLALVRLSLVLLVLILVHFTFFGALLVRFYRWKNNNAQINTQAYTSHQPCSTPYHIIKEYQKQTSLETKQDFKGY
jgi:hypothetical protein